MWAMGYNPMNLKRTLTGKVGRAPCILVATMDSMNFFPIVLERNPPTRTIVLTDFQLFRKSVPIADASNPTSPLKKHISEVDSITISHKQSVIFIEFSSLNYVNPEKMKYQYMLDGFDKDWINLGTKHGTTYTNLNPGKYKFNVRGLDSSGHWSGNVRALELFITPPFWQTWWFRGFSVFLIIGSALAFYSIRMKRIQSQKMELERLVRERTGEVVRQKEDLFYAIGKSAKCQW